MRGRIAMLLCGALIWPGCASAFSPEQICAALARQSLPNPSDFRLVAPKTMLDPANRAKAADGRVRVEVPFRDSGKGIKIATCAFSDGVMPDFMAAGERIFSKAEIEEFGRRLETAR